MWTKRYIFHPTKEEYFKTKHPIGSICAIIPLLIYYVYAATNDLNSPWLVMGAFGCLVFGIGLGYGFGILLKVYDRYIVPIGIMTLGIAMTVTSLIMVLR